MTSHVKSKQAYRLRVIEERPLRAWTLRMLALLLFVGGIAASYQYGLFQGQQAQADVQEATRRLQQELLAAQAAETELRQQLANLQLGAQVDRQAAEDVRQEVMELKNQLADLHEENSFYRNLMAPSENREGLNFGTVEISDTEVPRRFRYKVVLQQLTTNHQVLNGTLTFNVVGRQNGSVVVLPLSDLADDVDSVNIKLRFKYFQTVQGQFQLPDDFEPERIELVATSTGRNAVTREKRLGWLVQET